MTRALLALLAFVAACHDEQSADRTAEVQAPPARRAVAREELERLERELGPAAAPATPSEELLERVHGLLDTLVSSDAAMRRIAKSEFAEIGPGALPALARALEDPQTPAERTTGAALALGELDLPAAAEVLLARIEGMRTRRDERPWVRAHCAWRLGSGAQDWVVPRLILHLRYETDHETVAWIARTLAHFGNYSGLEALGVIASTGKTAEIVELAARTLRDLASERGFESANQIFAAWNDGDPSARLENPPFSTRHAREAWRIIAGFSEWQLRGVDDGRFTLARESAPVAPLLAAALADENRYVRTHAAQTLERMGKRARASGPALVAALDDAEIACQVAETLGAIGWAAAEPMLIERLSAERPLELRTSCARALGRLALASSATALDPWTSADVQLDLRVAASCARVRCSPADASSALLMFLLVHLTSGQVDSAEPEGALFVWLETLARSDASAEAVRGTWLEASKLEPAARVAERAKLVQPLLGRGALSRRRPRPSPRPTRPRWRRRSHRRRATCASDCRRRAAG